MWCQIIIHYNSEFRNDLITIHKAGTILRRINQTLWWISKRSFFLFEMGMDDCHNFVAFELKNKSLSKIGRIYSNFLSWWLRGEKISWIEFKENTSDYSNKEPFLDILCNWCKNLSLNYEDFFDHQRGRPKGLKKISHILHCMMNATWGLREEEITLYKSMIKWYKVYGSTIKKKRKK